MTNEELAELIDNDGIYPKELALAALDGDLNKVHELDMEQIKEADETLAPVQPARLRANAEQVRAWALVCSRLAAITESIAIEVEKENDGN